MANTNSPFGLRSVSRLDGGVFGRLKSDYNIANALAQNIGIGDVVAVTGTSAPATDPRYAGPYLTTTGVGSTAAPIGVFGGCAYQDPLGNLIWGKNWLSATSTLNSQGAQAFVEDDPQIVFEVQGDSTGIATTNILGYFGITNNAAPSTLGISTLVIAHTSNATPTDVYLLRVLKLSPAYNNAFGAYSKVYVQFGYHALLNVAG